MSPKCHPLIFHEEFSHVSLSWQVFSGVHENKSIAFIKIEGFLDTGCLDCHNEKDRKQRQDLTENCAGIIQKYFPYPYYRGVVALPLYNGQDDFRPSKL